MFEIFGEELSQLLPTDLAAPRIQPRSSPALFTGKPPILHVMRDWLLHHSQSLPGCGGPGYLCSWCSTGWGGMAKVWKDFAKEHHPNPWPSPGRPCNSLQWGQLCDTITSRGLYNNNIRKKFADLRRSRYKYKALNMCDRSTAIECQLT